jgi:hypothetical protein
MARMLRRSGRIVNSMAAGGLTPACLSGKTTA